MRATSLLALVSALPCLASGPARDLRVGEGFANPLGFHDSTPSFSWKLPEGAQIAYRIVAASSPAKPADEADLWDSGKISSSQSAWVDYAGMPPAARQPLVHDHRDVKLNGNPPGRLAADTRRAASVSKSRRTSVFPRGS